MQFYTTDDVCHREHFGTMLEKYHGIDEDAFRWSLKPVFVGQLIKSIDQTIAFVDPDQFFYGDPAALFTQTDQARFLLSPHDRPIDPAVGKMFHTNFTGGFFNGGLFVARTDSLDILDWWAAQCAYKCEINPELGLYVDQKYLDAVVTNFTNTDFIRHRGVSVASWNMQTRERKLQQDRSITIDDEPLICIHFTGSTIRMIDFGADACLTDALAEYRKTLLTHGVELPVSQNRPKQNPVPSSSIRKWIPNSLMRYAKQIAGRS